jgi:hypothetical protein
MYKFTFNKNTYLYLTVGLRNKYNLQLTADKLHNTFHMFPTTVIR